MADMNEKFKTIFFIVMLVLATIYIIYVIIRVICSLIILYKMSK